MPEVSGLPEPGSAVLVTGAGVTGRAILAALAPLGVRAALTDDRPAALAEYALGGESGLIDDAKALAGPKPYPPQPFLDIGAAALLAWKRLRVGIER